MSGYLSRMLRVPLIEILVGGETGNAAIDDDAALAAERVGHPLGVDLAELHVVDADVVGAGGGDALIERYDDDALLAGFLDDRIERCVGGGIDHNRVDLVGDHVRDDRDLFLGVGAGIVDGEGRLALQVLRRVGLHEIDHFDPPFVPDVGIRDGDAVFLRQRGVAGEYQ